MRGASTHNLQAIDCDIPHSRVTVVTGVSGAGKSSLAFDTIYAEAQRRYVESMSTYVRQFLEQMERPDVEAIRNVLPAVSFEARNSVRNARSTVGTLTDIHDILRLLFTHLGEVECPNGHGPVQASGPQEVASLLVERHAGDQVTLVAALPRPGKNANDKLKELVRQGYFRRYVGSGEVGAGDGDGDGDEGDAAKDSASQIERLTPSSRWTRVLDPLLLALGRFRPSEKSRARLIAAVEEAYQLAAGKVQLFDAGGQIHHFGRGLTCEICGARAERPTPALFSFNSPLGACPTCQGFGRIIGVDRLRVIPDASKSLDERPIAPWNSPAYKKHYAGLLRVCRDQGIPTDLPVAELSSTQGEFLWTGKGRFTNLETFFRRLERKKYRMHVRVLLARYRAYEKCPTCDGQRLKPEALAVRVCGRNLAELDALSVEDLRRWLESEEFLAAEAEAARHICDQLRSNLATLSRVGLDYLTLDRQARTLSGGESQRIHLASALGTGLTGALYVLDEPTIGLHPRDSDRLLALLGDLAARGNTVLVVEHDRTLIEGADHVIDLGPRAGEHGGRVMAEGSLEDVLANSESATARYLRQPPPIRDAAELETLSERLAELPRVEIRGARAHNLRGFDLSFPLGCLVAMTGLSGSGKSTLVENVLYGTYQRSKGVVDVEPGECDALEGLDDLADVVLVDQRPLGRSSRSNPVTYTKAYDDIRKLFAATPDADRRAISAGHFSFNIDKGRCETCKGTGSVEVDMQFMAPVEVLCESCQGKRFKPEVLAIRLRGKNIYETLELSVEEALEHFADVRRLCRKLRTLADVGLGYLRLGQSTSTLSGGEAQRLKLASFLDRPEKEGRRLFLFDEPTTGLHLADIDLLHSTLRRLLEKGHGVLVVEHALDLVARADWIVDLGPGGGVHGGELLYSGPLESFLDTGSSPTAELLRDQLGWPLQG